MNIGSIHLVWNDYDEVLKKYKKALEIKEQIGDLIMKSKIFYKLMSLGRL